MATLTEAAYHTRRAIKIVIFVLIGLIGLKIIQKTFNIAWKRLNPPRPPAPTVSFGKLPNLKFPENKDLPESLNFRLETIEGKLPLFSNILQVYFIPKNLYTYLTLERAQNRAKLLGFTNHPNQPFQEEKTIYQWEIKNFFPSSLTMDIISQNFQFEYDYRRDQALLAAPATLNNDQALVELKRYLAKVGILHNDLKKGTANFTPYRYIGSQLVRADSISETDFIKVNLFREPIKKFEILPANPYEANISALVSKSDQRRIVQLDFAYFQIDQEVWATYPTKDTTQAWEELKNGQGHIANLGDNETGEIVIRKVSLAYFDPPTYQPYLQPVFVFSGDHRFTAYVPAITDQWTQR
ncbi:hypothetical protein ACFLZP_02875 [Patescibacteria group bacterium]